MESPRSVLQRGGVCEVLVRECIGVLWVSHSPVRVCVLERETHRDTERHTETDRETERQRDREIEVLIR